MNSYSEYWNQVIVPNHWCYYPLNKTPLRSIFYRLSFVIAAPEKLFEYWMFWLRMFENNAVTTDVCNYCLNQFSVFVCVIDTIDMIRISKCIVVSPRAHRTIYHSDMISRSHFTNSICDSLQHGRIFCATTVFIWLVDNLRDIEIDQFLFKNLNSHLSLWKHFTCNIDI